MTQNVQEVRSVSDVYVGKDLGWLDVDTSPEAVDHYMYLTDDRHDWYTTGRDGGPPITPPTFLHYQAFRHTGWFLPNGYGTLFARQQWDWYRPLRIGEPAQSHAWIAKIERRRDRWHVTCELECLNGEQQIVLRTRTTQSFLADESYRGVVKSRTPAAPAPAPSKQDQPDPEQPLKDFRITVDVPMCERFFGGIRNYHTDREASKDMGFDDIVVGGPMSVCYIGHMLSDNLGYQLFDGGTLEIKFVDINWPDSTVVVEGWLGSEATQELTRERRTLRVRVSDQESGRTTVVGSGSVVV